MEISDPNGDGNEQGDDAGALRCVYSSLTCQWNYPVNLFWALNLLLFIGQPVHTRMRARKILTGVLSCWILMKH